MMRQAALTMEMPMVEPTDEDNEFEAAILALKTRRDLDAIKPKFRTEILIEIGSYWQSDGASSRRTHPILRPLPHQMKPWNLSTA
jgi:hypothetical protein